ncbi:YihY/virulence factor BrkB family protein [Nodularia spumigena]|uniref:YihY/virulence factor BrkB family protein n=1 Tax=Nodularia spumigena UHCC 0060 TaxID=3110300 RepID=A0ABU5URT1_NODSP|nr:YihY/virulence factor BrkB family protein [Nodularia spumigena]MEA5524543.1 YihY/virulence factor BrkB family protein [Nodularia spumigena UHCC 0143]MEA5608697.1 YihY/virulence factor BrkB family protein [Nodularia spumigena UHCC 0060]MEA5614002.1 YihY/virulence factor BrkB family protein [Nodularia spumigena UHCC 0040]
MPYLVTMVTLRKIRRLLTEIFSDWQLNEVPLLASSLAYYSVFSLAPLLVLLIMIVGTIFGESVVQEEVISQLSKLFGEEGAKLISTAIVNLRVDSREQTFQIVFNLGFLLFGATGVFTQIQAALNRIWKVKPVPRHHVLNLLHKRVLCFLMVLVIAVVLILFFVSNAILARLVIFLNELVPGSGYLWQFMSLLITFGGTTLMFTMMYSILPDAEIAWRDTIVGALITSVLFLVGQYLFGQFLSRTNFGSAYGVAGSFVIVITWIFFAAHILFLGAEFTKVYAKQRGAAIVPSEYAVHLPAEQQQHQLFQPKKRHPR